MSAIIKYSSKFQNDKVQEISDRLEILIYQKRKSRKISFSSTKIFFLQSHFLVGTAF